MTNYIFGMKCPFRRLISLFKIQYVIPIVCLALVVFVFQILDKNTLSEDKSDSARILLQEKYAKPLSLGHGEMLASLFWVKCLVDYGNSMLTGNDFLWFTHYVALVTTLDEQFALPYYYLGAITPMTKSDTMDIPVLRKGHQIFPENWRLALFLALRLSEGPSHANLQASQIMETYAHAEKVPDYVHKLGQSFRIKGLPKRIGLQQLLEQYVDPSFHAYQIGTEAKIQKLVGVSRESQEAKALHAALVAFKKDPEQLFPRLYGDLVLLLDKSEQLNAMSRSQGSDSIER